MREKVFLIPACALLAGCTVGPNYAGPPVAASDAVARGTFVRASDPSFRADLGVARWWESLNDPLLTRLVDDGLAQSPNIDLAQARIREAASQLTQQQANQLPSISANGTYLRAQLPGTGLGGGSSAQGGGSSSTLTFYNVGANASWEPDLFGGGRRGVEQSRANVGRRFADLADAQVSLAAQIAQAYVNLRDAQERSRLNAQSSELQKRAITLTKQRFQAGTASTLDLERLQTQFDQTQAQNIPLKTQVDEYLNQLAVLTGRTPGALDPLLTSATPVPLPPAKVPIGDPASLIARRPDIRSAERALAASNAQIGVNTAKLYPSLRFMGILGLGGSTPGAVLDPSNLSTILAPMLSWSFLDFGRTRASIRQSEAQRDQASAQYREALLEALQDAETSLSRFGTLRLQLAQLLQAEASASRAANLNAQRLRAGTTSLIDQLDVERQRLSAASAVAQARAQLTISYIAVNKSLGLGWTELGTPPPAQVRSR
ncbi:efflux transporter outer membrane subunit [Sphingomonas ginkgonis]|uniref:Efflux transporter outer membrane subunit n=1 Tax=Sphingomonas ginkgonis TaxID=2315330 RepID=A0A3R9YJF8_9SPHN|nr:efflux transporter outer membrane subunit [Sphingomonas ginkgonis]RST31315.1 efflux transporter outer membrane subunit [Sphingomonas ginkgonis]